MKILKQENLLNYIDALLANKDININVADMLLSAFNYTDIIDFNNFESLDENKEIINQLYDFWQLDKNNKENNQIIDEYVSNNLFKLDDRDYINEYLKNFMNFKSSNGKMKIKKLTIQPYQLIPIDEIKVSKNGYKEYSQVGYFDHQFTYLALCENNNVWMSLNPNEINTMKPYIEKAKGKNILVLGMGLCYVPYMIALKNEVENIDIIDNDMSIIGMYMRDLYYAMPKQIAHKMVSIKDDAISYIKTEDLTKYDYIFADLWHNPEDGLPLFIEIKKVEKQKNIQIDCWLEESLVSLLRRCMLTVIEESLQNMGEENYKFARNETDKVINLYYHKTKNQQIQTIEDVDNLLTKDNLINLLF